MEENYLFERNDSKDLAEQMDDMFDEIDTPLTNPDLTMAMASTIESEDKITEETEQPEETPLVGAFMTHQTLAMFFWGFAKIQRKSPNNHGVNH